MDLTYPGWQTQTTATTGCPAQPTLCGAAGVNLFWIWPADAVGNNNLTLNVLTNAPTLVKAGDFINLDSTEIVGILDYGQFRLSLKRGGVFFQRTIPLFKRFLVMLADRNSYLVNLDIFRQMIGQDLARNYYPRRQSERSGRATGIGVR